MKSSASRSTRPTAKTIDIVVKRRSTRPNSRRAAIVPVDGRAVGVDEGAIFAEPVTAVQRIAERAYMLYLARNGKHGDSLADWLEAERQVTEEVISILASRR